MVLWNIPLVVTFLEKPQTVNNLKFDTYWIYNWTRGEHDRVLSASLFNST